jgi:hypothetical protein
MLAAETAERLAVVAAISTFSATNSSAGRECKLVRLSHKDFSAHQFSLFSA